MEYLTSPFLRPALGGEVHKADGFGVQLIYSRRSPLFVSAYKVASELDAACRYPPLNISVGQPRAIQTHHPRRRAGNCAWRPPPTAPAGLPPAPAPPAHRRPGRSCPMALGPITSTMPARSPVLWPRVRFPGCARFPVSFPFLGVDLVGRRVPAAPVRQWWRCEVERDALPQGPLPAVALLHPTTGLIAYCDGT